MDRLREYKIAFRGLGEGKHSFEFIMDEGFFDCFEATKGTRGEVKATVLIVKSSLLMEVRITIEGMVKAGIPALSEDGKSVMNTKLCKEAMVVAKELNDDYIILSPEDDYLDVSSYLYETYMLNYPMRVVHPEGECDEDMQEVLHEYVIEEDDKPIDPRWNELKKLINN